MLLLKDDDDTFEFESVSDKLDPGITMEEDNQHGIGMFRKPADICILGIYAAYRKEDVECHAKCLTPNKYYEVAEIFGTLDVTGSYLRNDECAGEKQAAKEVSVDSGYAPVQEKLSTGQ